MNCTHCESTGFLNLEQVDEPTYLQFLDSGNVDVILEWIATNNNHDVAMCDCCGDGQEWYGEPGHHHLGAEEPFPECY